VAVERDLDILHRIISARGGFGHREHLELAWTYLARYEVEAAHQAMAAAVRHAASLHGAPNRYHETITRSWVHLVALHRSGSAAGSFDEFISENSGLLDQHLLDHHYSRPLIASHEARASWTEPDLRGLPILA
jgi:hypothetical protein